MCGIAGAWRLAPLSLPRADVQAALAHRGPDDAGWYENPRGDVVLAHSRLAILDLSEAGAQPMASPDGQVVLVFNGEIYNFQELGRELEAEGVEFAGHSDTEVLLHLYLRDGVDMLQRLNGIFAFALYDARTDDLFLARDALGVKPLYLHEGENGVAFASEIKALLPLAPGRHALDLASLHRYLTYLWCPGDGTPAADIRKVLPGEALLVRSGRVERRWTWYRLPVHRVRAVEMTAEEAIAKVRAGVRTAVHRQMVSDVPVGAFLSGGLDSSAVVAFAREVNPGVRCFTIDVEGDSDAGMEDDLPYAQRVAEHLGVQLDVVRVEASTMADDLQGMVAQLDEPLADPAPLNVLYISQVARRNGIKVLLSGAGGDDLFTGYRRHVASSYEDWWAWLPAPVRSGIGSLSRFIDHRTATGRRVGRLVSSVALRGDDALVSYFAWARRDQLLPLYHPDFRAAIADVRAEEPMRAFLRGLPRDAPRLERLLALEQRFFLADHNLIYTDKMSMAAGVEVRVPFLDLDLVDLAATIPGRYKQRGQTGKWVLKKAMEPDLPRDILYRSKSGFGAPLRRWLHRDLRPLMAEVLSESSLRRRGLFDPAAVHRLIAAHDTGRVDAAYTLLSLICIELWCRRFIDEAVAGRLPLTRPSTDVQAA